MPNVSLCEQENEVHYKPYDPYNGHEYVDLGLPSGTKWATVNVGANSVTDYGNHYQYGKGAATYQETSGQTDYEGYENPLAASADTATQVWGGSWHMPTIAQIRELTANTTYQGVTINGIKCGKFTAQNGNYVLFPSAGMYINGTLKYVGFANWAWSSTHYGGNDDVYNLYTTDGLVEVQTDSRDKGHTIRPVVG